jgi:nitrogen fixation/metabolism regulation signal transduction histidine kinase
MNVETLPDIPRLYTALAEWAACLVYILILKKRFAGFRMILGIVLGLLLQALIQLAAGMMPLALWVPGMIAAVGGMYGIIHANSGVSPRDAGYCCVSAFILAEFAASLSWQLCCFFFMVRTNAATPGGALFTLLVYGIVFVPMFFFERRHMEQEGRLHVRRKELWSAAIIASATFMISNISFVTANTPFSSRLVPELFYIRTLVDFCGLVILYTHQEQRREMQLQSELKAMESILQRQFAQYQHSRESMDIINRKYHDIKHQIAVIRAEGDPAKRAAYLDEIDQGIRMHEAQNKTGNGVLDTVLATKDMICKENHITLTCVADGALLDFMDVMDLCSIFGNALDNAIEGVLKTEDPEKRLIRVALYSQNKFILICCENYFEGNLKLENGIPATTKSDRGSHGFGLKSIRYTAEKYGGSMTINTEETWFILRVLLPRA